MLTAPFGLRYESVESVGAWLEAETCFSRPRLSRGEPAVPIPKSSTAAAFSRFFLPHNLHATMARPPTRIAPPIPPTTPPMMDLVCGDMLLPPLPEPPFASVGSMVAVATSVEETTREPVTRRERTVPSSVKYEVVVNGSVDSRTMFVVMVVLEAKVDGSKVLLPMTTTGSSSVSDTVWTAEVPVRGADDVTGMDDVMVLPSLSVVVTAVCDVGVLDGDADVPVPDSDGSSEVVASVDASED